MSAILLERVGVFLHADLGLEFGFPNTGEVGGADGQRAHGDDEECDWVFHWPCAFSATSSLGRLMGLMTCARFRSAR